MKKTIKLSVLALSLAMSGLTMAQSVPTGQDNPAKFPSGIVPNYQNSGQVAYQGLDYPKPNIDNKVVNTPSLSELMSGSISQKADAKESVNEMKRSALIEVASAVGASAGAAHRMKELKDMVNGHAARLDVMYDFKQMKLTEGVMLPVLVQGLGNYNKNSDDEIRISDKKLKVEAPAKFVSVYPTWRNYLIFSLPAFEVPPTAYLPKTDAERAIWDDAVKKGWDKGIEQANRIFETSYSRLERDYMGMDLSKILIDLKMLTPTIVAKQNLGVTGGGREMDINDQVFRITDHSGLNPNPKAWATEYPVTSNSDGNYK